MAADPRNKNGNERRKLKQRLRYEGRPCHLCGYQIRYDLSYPHKQSFVVDEYETVKDGGSTTSRSNCFPAHACCNAWRGCKDVTPQLRRTIRDRYEREILHKAPQHRQGSKGIDDGFW